MEKDMESATRKTASHLGSHVSAEGTKPRLIKALSTEMLMPNIGYGNKMKTTHMLLSDFQKFLVLEVLLMCHKSYSAEIAPYVSSKDHKAIMERAAQMAIRVSNSNARIYSEESE
ncbi:large ribosomal subunit protein eL32-like [Eubalaena glacialis]|nr:large ribosomal subunit protein eL32-like [Eubalaena glacialis]